MYKNHLILIKGTAFAVLFWIGMLINRSGMLAMDVNSAYLIGEWNTSDGVVVTFNNDGSFTMEWGWEWYPEERGSWKAEETSDDTFEIQLEGSSILTLMSGIYGLADSDYHFEVLKCSANSFYLVQVYGDYSAKSSPCKLGFTRSGYEPDYSYKEDDPEGKIHIVRGIKSKEESNFTFHKNEELEDLVFERSSMDYNPRLAHFLAVMARSAYTESLVKDNYSELGLGGFNGNGLDPKHYNEDEYAAFLIGNKKLQDGSELVMVTIRGSYSGDEWQKTNFNSLFDSNSDNFLNLAALTDDRGWHEGFSKCATNILEELKYDLGGRIETQNTKYIITGHSLGAGVGNLLSILLKEEGVPNSAVVGYFFACPNVGVGKADLSVWNDRGINNNIINIGNWCDLVTHSPTNDILNFSNDRWKRYGQSYWFTNGYRGIVLRTGYQNPIDAHDMKSYIEYMEKELDVSQYIDSEYVVDVISARCPVDVALYDENHKEMVAVADNEIDYFGEEIGERTFVTVDGDHKLIFVYDEGPYDVIIKGTDYGEMDYSIGRVDLFSGEIQARKDFKGVALSPGKTMTTSMVKSQDISDVELYTTDNNGSVLAEIMEDGSETPIHQKEVVAGASDLSEGAGGKVDTKDTNDIGLLTERETSSGYFNNEKEKKIADIAHFPFEWIWLTGTMIIVSVMCAGILVIKRKKTNKRRTDIESRKSLSNPQLIYLAKRGDFVQAVWRLSGKQTIIGSSYDGVTYHLHNNRVSRRHAMFTFEQGEYFLTDLGSKNGTSLNGIRVEPGKKYVIHSGDRIALFDERFVFVVHYGNEHFVPGMMYH